MNKLLGIAEAYFQETIAPQAARIDSEEKSLNKALKGMGDRSLLALCVPKVWGGAELTVLDLHCFQIMVARYSGALAFLQTQHQMAATDIVGGDNESLKQKYLPLIARGEVLLGVGYSQLRRKGPPLLKALPVKGGYQLEGTVPWITGFGFFDYFIIGAALPNGDGLFGVAPFREDDQESGGRIRFSPPLELTAMNPSNTVEGEVNKWFLSDDEVITIKAADIMRENDRKNVLYNGFFALGCARAGLDILKNIYRQKQLPLLKEAFQSLKQTLDKCQNEAFLSVSEKQSFKEKLVLRARMIHLATRCSHAAVVASSGAANTRHHPAGRVYREALMFSVFGQTTALMEETLKQLLPSSVQ